MEPKKYVIINKKQEIFELENELFNALNDKLEYIGFEGYGGYNIMKRRRMGERLTDDKYMFMVYYPKILGKRYIMDIELDGSFIYIKNEKYEKLATMISEVIYPIIKKTVIITYTKSFFANEYEKIKRKNIIRR